MGRPGTAVLKVYDAAGRLVRTLEAGQLEAGNHSLKWDGKDSAGMVVQPGVYFCRMLAGGDTINHKIVLVR